MSAVADTPALFRPPSVITRPAMRLWTVQVGDYHALVIADREGTAVDAAVASRKDQPYAQPGESITCEVVEIVGPPRALIGWWPSDESEGARDE